MNIKEKFAPANLCDKTCNISPDETNLEALDTGTLKRLSGGDNIQKPFELSAKDKSSFILIKSLTTDLKQTISVAYFLSEEMLSPPLC